jgi:hypothetical protein
MKYVYRAALRLSYIISDLAEFIAQPLTDCIWDLGGNIECWAHTKLTKLEDKDPKTFKTPASWAQATDFLHIDAPTGWVGHDRYREAIAEIEAAMRGEVPEQFKGMTSQQAYNKLSDELVDDLLKQEQR